MAEESAQEGHAPFAIPSIDTPCFTYYKIFGNLQSRIPPVIVIHGGAGAAHEYLLPLKELWSQYGIPVIFYDQIGCAGSTHLPQKLGDESFWQVNLFVAELENLINHLGLNRADGPGFHIYGHSWGGRVAVAIAARRPPGLQRLIIAGASANGQTFLKEIQRLSKQISPEGQRALHEAVEKDDFASPAYQAAMLEFRKMYLVRSDPWPHPLYAISERHQAEDSTVIRSMTGKSVWTKTDGNMIKWDCIPILPKISATTLLVIGEFDTAQEMSNMPFFDLIPKVRWVTIPGASHMPFLDQGDLPEKYLKVLGTFVRPETLLDH